MFKRLLTDSLSVEFSVLLNRVFGPKLRDNINSVYNPPILGPKIGQNNPKIRRKWNPLTISKKFFGCILIVLYLQANTLEVEEHFAFVKQEVESRWSAFASERTFSPFVVGKSDEEIIAEFEALSTIREQIWETEGFTFAQHLIDGDLIRAPGCIAFDYNNTVPYYNASTIWLSDRCFLACEGPRSKDISKFFTMLSTFKATHLVRLTDSYEGATKKCHPYWEGLLRECAEGGIYLDIPVAGSVYSLRAVDMASWRDHHGIEPEELLAVIVKLRDELAQDKGLAVVHCSAGVGRTGTFLAAYEIVQAIDQGTPFSIEEIVYRLSLQRVHTVAKKGQYVTLYRLAETYIKQKEKKDGLSYCWLYSPSLLSAAAG